MKKRPEYDMKATGINLKKMRIQKNLSVEEVREYMHLGSVQSIYKWERGECYPQADNFIALAQLYEVNPADMLIKKKFRSHSAQLSMIKHMPEKDLRKKYCFERYLITIMSWNKDGEISDCVISGFLRRRLEMHGEKAVYFPGEYMTEYRVDFMSF